MLLSAFIRESVAVLEKIYPSPEARGMVLMLCEERLGVRNYTHITEPKTEIPDDRLDGLRGDVARLSSGEPVQYVLGYADFFGRRFNVSPSVLIPRPETEMLVRDALDEGRRYGGNVRVLDLCTGSGCIAWSLALELPSSEVVAVDISPEALDVARSQFPEGGPEFVQADVLSCGDGFGRGKFDIVVSNPPYIMEGEKSLMRSNVLDYEPSLALFVPDADPLVFYRAVAGWLDSCLAPEGCCLVEINESLGPETAAVFRSAGYANVSIRKDFYGKDRFLFIKKRLPEAL